MSQMKIVVGMGSIDDYLSYAEAGGDEFFIGYLPLDYQQAFGRERPINRREVIYYNVQIGSESELMILRKAIEKINKEVSLAFNAISLSWEQRLEIVKIIDKCRSLGYINYIIADLELIDMLSGYKDINIEVSGELGEINHQVVKLLGSRKVKRIIFPRQTSIDEMKDIIDKNSESQLEYEAFVLNEKCHFTGAYCNSLHCDELCHMCKVPYRLTQDENFKSLMGASDNDSPDPENAEGDTESVSFEDAESEDYITGSSGCGLCALWRLREAGVSHLKLVSRGNSSQDTLEDIKVLRKALDILDKSKSQDDYIKRMKAAVFKDGCSGNCYYID